MPIFPIKKVREKEIIISEKDIKKAGLYLLGLHGKTTLYTDPIGCKISFTIKTLDHEKVDMDLFCFAKINYKKDLASALVHFANANGKECGEKLKNLIKVTCKLPKNTMFLYTYEDLIANRVKLESKTQETLRNILKDNGIDILSCHYQIGELKKPIKVTTLKTSSLIDPYEGSIEIEDTYEDIFASMHKHKQKEIKIYSVPFEPKSLDEVKNAFVIE